MGVIRPCPLVALSPFRLPHAYEEARERKVAALAELRNAVKAVRAPRFGIWGLHGHC